MVQKKGKPALRKLLDELDRADQAVAALLRWVEAGEVASITSEESHADRLYKLRAEACAAQAETIDGLIAKVLLCHDVLGTQVHHGDYWDPSDYRFEIAAAGEDEDLVASMFDALILIRAHEGRALVRA